jgi:hypothetical protein
MSWECTTNEEEEYTYRILIGKPEGRRQLGRSKLRWEYSIKMDFGERIGWYLLDWSGSRIPTAVNIGFLDRSRYFFIQVAPQLSSRG